MNILYVVDAQGRLLDDIRLREIVLAPPDKRVSDLMDRTFVALNVNDDQEVAVNAFKRYDRVALPVVDSHGILVGIVTVSLLVLMAFTLVLIPVTLVGLLAALVTLGYGLIGIGHLVGTLLPTGRDAIATALGVALALIGLWLVGFIPLIGDLAVAAVLLAGVGAVLVTYFGASRFRPDTLPD